MHFYFRIVTSWYGTREIWGLSLFCQGSHCFGIEFDIFYLVAVSFCIFATTIVTMLAPLFQLSPTDQFCAVTNFPLIDLRAGISQLISWWECLRQANLKTTTMAKLVMSLPRHLPFKLKHTTKQYLMGRQVLPWALTARWFPVVTQLHQSGADTSPLLSSLLVPNGPKGIQLTSEKNVINISPPHRSTKLCWQVDRAPLIFQHSFDGQDDVTFHFRTCGFYSSVTKPFFGTRAERCWCFSVRQVTNLKSQNISGANSRDKWEQAVQKHVKWIIFAKCPMLFTQPTSQKVIFVQSGTVLNIDLNSFTLVRVRDHDLDLDSAAARFQMGKYFIAWGAGTPFGNLPPVRTAQNWYDWCVGCLKVEPQATYHPAIKSCKSRQLFVVQRCAFHWHPLLSKQMTRPSQQSGQKFPICPTTGGHHCSGRPDFPALLRDHLRVGMGWKDFMFWPIPFTFCSFTICHIHSSDHVLGCFKSDIAHLCAFYI